MNDHSVVLWVGNGASVLTIFGTILGLLPPLAALAAIIWYLIQIKESKTFRDWHDARIRARKARKIERLQAQKRVVEAELAALDTKKAARDFAEHMVQTADAKVVAAKDDAVKNPTAS